MKTITSGGEIAALLETLPEGAIMRTSDGVANQFHRYGYGQYQEHLAGRGYWTRTDATYLPEIIPDRLLPATLLHPLTFGADDMERAMEATFEAIKLAPSRSREAVARAVLWAVGSVEA